MQLTKEYQKLTEKHIGNTGYGNAYLRLYVKRDDYEIANNRTKVYVKLVHYLEQNAGWVQYWSSSAKVTGDISETFTGSTNQQFNAGETTLIETNSYIKHNDDGTKSITLGGSFTNSFFGNTITLDDKIATLPTIPRASEVSSSSPYIGDNATIIISSKSSSFIHTLTYAFGSTSGTIATKTNLTTVPWDTDKIKEDLYKQIPNAKSGKGTITCETYNGNTLVGTKTCSFNLYAKESDCKPSIDGTVVDTNSSTKALTGNSAVMVRYMSKPKVTISSSANYSSSIKNYSINVDGQTTNSSEVTFDTISSNNITISVTDSRGYSNSKPLTPSMINYVKLTSNLTIERPEQTSNEAYLNGSGQWFNGSFSSSNANTLSINCEYRKSGDSSWISLGTLTPSKSGNTFSFSNLKLGESFDYKNEYQFRITIADKLQTIGNQTKDIVILSTGKAIVRIGKEKVVVNGELEVNGKIKKDILCAYLSSQQTLTTNADQRVKIPFDKYEVIGDKLTFNPSNKSIVIGEGVNKIAIKGEINYKQIASSSNRGIDVAINGSSYAQKLESLYGNARTFGSIFIELPIVPVKEGDIITLLIRSVAQTGVDMVVYEGLEATKLFVEVLE